MEIKLCGVGGQGLGFAGRLLGEAAIIAGLHVAQTTAYGVESRGGMSTSDVVISEGSIFFPEVRHPDFLLIMAEKGLQSNLQGIHSNTVIFYDNGTVNGIPGGPGRRYSYPFLDLALQKFDSREAATIIGLGAVVQISGVVPFQVLEEAIERYLSAKVQAQNLEAIRLGRDLVAKLKK